MWQSTEVFGVLLANAVPGMFPQARGGELRLLYVKGARGTGMGHLAASILLC
jgi:hypothetical protein